MIGTSAVPYATKQTAGWLVFLASDGATCVLWCDGVNQCYSYASDPSGAAWTTQTLVTGVNMALTGVLSSDNIHTVTGGPSDMTPYYRLLTKSGAAWSVGTANHVSASAIGTTGVGNVASYQIDPQGRHWLISGGPSTYLLNNAWYSATPSSGLWTSSSAAAQTAQSNLPVGDEVGGYAVKCSYNGTTLQFTRIANSGTVGSWSTLASVTNLTGTFSSSSISNFQMIDANRGLLVYKSSTGIYAQLYTPGTNSWSTSTQLSANTSDTSPTIVADGLGHAWVFWCQYSAANNYALVYKSFDGDSWDLSPKVQVASGTNITNPSGAFGGYQSIGVMYTVGTSNPYSVAWTSLSSPYSEKSFQGRIRVYAGSARSSSARAPVVPRGIVAYDSFARANQTYWGNATDTLNTWGADASSNAAITIANNTGIATNMGSASYSATLGPILTDGEVMVTGKLSLLNGTSNFGPVLRWQNGTNWYKALIDGSNVYIQKQVAGTSTYLATLSQTSLVNVSYTIKFQVMGVLLRMKLWPSAGVEPLAWTLTGTDATFKLGYTGIRFCTSSGTATFTAFQSSNQLSKSLMGRIEIYNGTLAVVMGRFRLSIGSALRSATGRTRLVTPIGRSLIGRVRVRGSSFLKAMGRTRIVTRLSKTYQGRVRVVIRPVKNVLGRMRLSLVHTAFGSVGRVRFYGRRTASTMGRVIFRILRNQPLAGRIRLIAQHLGINMGRVRVVTSQKRSSMGRARLAIPLAIIRMGIGRLRVLSTRALGAVGRARVGLVHQGVSLGRARLVNRRSTSLMGRSRVSLWMNRTGIGRVRFTLKKTADGLGRVRLVQKGIKISIGRIRFFSPAFKSVLGRIRIISSSGSRVVMGRIQLLMQSYLVRGALGRVRLSLAQSRSLMGRARVSVVMKRSGPGRIRSTIRVTRGGVGRSRMVLGHLGTVTGRVRHVMRSLRGMAGRTRLVSVHLSPVVGRARILSQRKWATTGRVRYGLKTLRTSMGRMRVSLGRFRSSIGRMRITVHPVKSVFGRYKLVSNAIHILDGRIRYTTIRGLHIPGRLCIQTIVSEPVVWLIDPISTIWLSEYSIFVWETYQSNMIWNTDDNDTTWYGYDTSAKWTLE